MGSAFGVFFGSAILFSVPLSAQVLHLRVADGQVTYTLVGQVTNTPPDRSIQYGYLPTIEGISDLFSSSSESEATAFFTFFNETRTKATRHSGPITVVEREGTTTIYAQSAPHGNFADPASFQGGSPVLVMSLKQQVVLDTGSRVFTVVTSNTVTDSERFKKDGQTYELASPGDQFRTSFTGTLNTSPPPSGYFSGYAVRIEKAVGESEHGESDSPN